jgi:hypothetical protein
MITILLNTKIIALAQYTNYSFNSITNNRKTLYAANENGIYQLDNAGTDSGDDINASIEIAITDFGVTNKKRIRALYISGKAADDLTVTITADEKEDQQRSYSLDTLHHDQITERKLPVGRDDSGKYWQVKIENVRGCDFTIDALSALLLILRKISK